MKLKRIAFVLSFVMCATITSIAASADDAEDKVTDDGVGATLWGSVGGVEGPNFITDKVWCNGYLYGSGARTIERAGCEAYIQPGTDKKTLKKSYLWNSSPIVCRNKESCGYGGSRAQLTIHLSNDVKHISVALE